MSSSGEEAAAARASSGEAEAKRRAEVVDAATSAFLEASRSDSARRMRAALEALRWAVLREGLGDPGGAASEYRDPATAGTLTRRGRVWKALLGLDEVDAEGYRALVARGRCEEARYRKIRGDTFRTFPQEVLFTSRVPEAANVRMLNSFVHRYGGDTFNYRQGMNALSAALLFCMPEPDAFRALAVVLLRKTPLYWLNDISGSHAGCKLVDEVLYQVDEALAKHLGACGLTAYLYAHHCVSSLCASVPPFNELLQLWDFLFAFGPHLNILCVAAQVVMLRDKLLAADRKGAKAILDYRAWPRLRARAVISVAMSLVPRLHPKLLRRVQLHAVDPAVCQEITQRPVKYKRMEL